MTGGPTTESPTTTSPVTSVPTRRGRIRAFAPAAVLVATGAGLLLVHTLDPGEPGNYPTCPWLMVTGTFCPGCGTLRMLHALTHGDVTTAVAMNPFALVMVVVLAAGWMAWAWQARWGLPVATWVPQWAATGYLVLTVVYWVARNLPGLRWLAPG